MTIFYLFIGIEVADSNGYHKLWRHWRFEVDFCLVVHSLRLRGERGQGQGVSSIGWLGISRTQSIIQDHLRAPLARINRFTDIKRLKFSLYSCAISQSLR